MAWRMRSERKLGGGEGHRGKKRRISFFNVGRKNEGRRKRRKIESEVLEESEQRRREGWEKKEIDRDKGEEKDEKSAQKRKRQPPAKIIL